MKYLILFFVIVFSSLLIISCSDLREDVPASAPELSLHKKGNSDPTSPNFHGKVVAGNNWSMKLCQQCHGFTYAGGTTGASCLNCHTSPEGPEACNTCHGDFSDPTKTAPPRALNGAILSSERGVGAHTKHLSENNLRVALDCTECHTVPSGFLDPVHIDKVPGAKLVFGNLTKQSTNVSTGFNYQPSLGNFNPIPVFDIAAGTCANTYCHGYFKNGNINNIVAFTAQSQGSACGSCHGDATTGNPLPKTPAQGGVHPPNQNCATVYCHGDVVSIDSTSAQIYTIIDKNKHINGKLNFAGNEYTY